MQNQIYRTLYKKDILKKNSSGIFGKVPHFGNFINFFRCIGFGCG